MARKADGRVGISVFITTLNNDNTLTACLESVKWADEIVILDSFSSDKTEEIAKRYRCKFFQNKFLGYGPQKQLALSKTTCPVVLLLDADEMLSEELSQEIQDLLERGLEHDGYEIKRLEQIFWKMSSPRVSLNYTLRLFRRKSGKMSTDAVHADPVVTGSVGRLTQPFYHFGESSIHVKVDKINFYSSGMVQEKVAKGNKGRLLTMLFYPPFVFIQNYLFKCNFINGVAGLIGSLIMAQYAFLKYAKVYEWHQRHKKGSSLLPEGAPSMPDVPDVPK